MSQQASTTSEAPGSGAAEGQSGFQLPWAAIPKFSPGITDVTEYSRKLEFLAAMWPKEHLSLLAPRAALQVEGTAFKKIANLPADKLKSNDVSGVKLLVSTLGGSWGKTDLEAKYDVFEKALYGTVQKQDETNDSYLARHDVHFEELLSQNVTFEQVRAYILLRQSQLTAEDRKKIILELGGSLDYKRVCSSIRLLGSRFFADLQGQRVTKARTYDANTVDEPPPEGGERAFQASTASAAEEGEADLDDGFMEAMLASDDSDALQVQAFEEELENFFQDTPELQEALVSYMEARTRLLAKKKSRGFWPVGGGAKGASKGGRGFKGGGKGKGKHREQLLARIARSTCRICGEKGHWKAECPRRKGNASAEATTTVAEAFVEVPTTASAFGANATQEILTSLPADAMTLEEVLCVNNPSPPNVIARNLKKLVSNLQNPRKPSHYSALRPQSSGVPHSTDVVCSDVKPVQCLKSEVAAIAQDPTPVEAILDTGASRCVMGKSLLQTFIGQLSDSVRSKVRFQKSAIRFRFGNNQTLLSDRRVLLPFRTTDHQVLWLGIEVVPGRTPLLFSKKAIKQLGGVINTITDVCELRRLQRSLQMQTGPTGLYMIDLSRLCEESNLEASCQQADEDLPQAPPAADPCMISQPLEPGIKDRVCIVSPQSFRAPRVKNSPCALKHSVASAVNEVPQATDLPDQLPAQVCEQRTCVSAAAPALNCAIRFPTPRSQVSSPLPQHGPDQQPRRDCERRRPEVESGSSPAQAAGSSRESPSGGHPESQPRAAWRAQGLFRHQNEGTHFSGVRRVRARLDQVAGGTLPKQHKALPPDLHPVCGEICESGRVDRGRAQRRAECRRDIQDSPSRTGEQSCSKGSPEDIRRRRRHSVGADRRPWSPRSGCTSEQPHDSDGASHAGDDRCHSTDECHSEQLVSEVAQCQRELNALIAQNPTPSPSPEAIEQQAKELMQGQPTLSEIRVFLKRVPWHLFGEGESRASVISGNAKAQRPLAYASFGMYVHGGVVGVTKMTKQFPWITRALTGLVQSSDPQHRFSTIGVSCNACAAPHRDSYNSDQVENLVIPLEYPISGGEIWVAQKPHARQSAQERICGNVSVPGTLVALKPTVYIDPHRWHATAPWTGDRVLAIGYCLKATAKLGAEDRTLLKKLGFRLPITPTNKFGSALHVDSVQHDQISELRSELNSATSLLSSDLPVVAQAAADACTTAFQQVENAAWNVYQDSLLSYNQPCEPQLDLLEVYAGPDSRLTEWVRSQGGRARRFTEKDGDLATADGQRQLWNLLQRTQPRHVWMAPSSRVWCSWTSLNNARSPQAAQRTRKSQQDELVHLRLCAKICEWQKTNQRHFHLEQPIASRMLSEPVLQPVVAQTQRIVVDMCAFGFQTPVQKVPIRKRTVILSTSTSLVRSLVQKQCPGHPEHQPYTKRVRLLQGLSSQAGSYCSGFAKHVALQMLQSFTESVLAVEGSMPLTRKRFKTSLGHAQPSSSLPAQKRASEALGETDSRS